jgi:hypothetical protein
MTETGWLVEKRGLGRPYWLTAYLGQLTFSADANDAIRFSRRQDAEAIIAELYDQDSHVATEHQWGDKL